MELSSEKILKSENSVIKYANYNKIFSHLVSHMCFYLFEKVMHFLNLYLTKW